MFGSFTFHGNVDNSYKGYCKLYVKQGGEYRLTAFKVPPQPLCDLINNENPYVKEFEKVSNFTQPVLCPVPKVKHSFDIIVVQALFC
jgi:hypothetical protein